MAKSMKVLLDAGILIHSEFAQPTRQEKRLHWGNTDHVVQISGFMRKALDKDDDQQAQKNALFTVGRLMREGRIEAYSYIEIENEVRQARLQYFNALQGCAIRRCVPPLERSKFRKTANLKDWFAKGGKKDRLAGVALGGANQIAFFSWLNELSEMHVQILVKHAQQIGLSVMEVESLNDLRWFQFLCNRWNSPENYPDIFHLWTAERNHCDVLLTLDKGIQKLVARVAAEKTKTIEIRTEVLRPLDLLRKLSVAAIDPVPMESGRFYSLLELPEA
jgi:hypothetical protein